MLGGCRVQFAVSRLEPLGESQLSLPFADMLLLMDRLQRAGAPPPCTIAFHAQVRPRLSLCSLLLGCKAADSNAMRRSARAVVVGGAGRHTTVCAAAAAARRAGHGTASPLRARPRA
jgi:hypothetical protein